MINNMNKEKTTVKEYNSQIPLKYEPLKNNRFIVKFPTDMGLQVWWVEGVKMPKYKNEEWEDIEVNFRCLMNPSVNKQLFNNLLFAKNFEINIELLDPTNTTIEEFVIQIDKTNSIDFGGNISYDNHNMLLTKVSLKTSSVKII